MRVGCALGLTLVVAATGCTRQAPPNAAAALVPATSTMVTAWEVPKNPLTDRSLGDSPTAREIRWGYQLFTNTPKEAPALAHGQIACSNCHLNAGQRDRALPLVGVAGMFPEPNKRSGRTYQLVDRIVDCFWRSENGTGVLEDKDEPGLGARGSQNEMLPNPTSKEVLAIGAYLTWLARGTANLGGIRRSLPG